MLQSSSFSVNYDAVISLSPILFGVSHSTQNNRVVWYLVVCLPANMLEDETTDKELSNGLPGP